MKKIYLVLILVFSQNAVCQDYVFDKFIEYEEVGRSNVFFMFNSKDSTYFFYGFDIINSLNGIIIDKKIEQLHRYKVDAYKKEIDFAYLYSEPLISDNHVCPYAKNSYQTKQIEKDSLTSFEIKKFKNDKKRIILATTTVNTVKSELIIFPTLMKYLFAHFICCQDLNLPSNYLITSATIKYSNGNEVVSKLKQTKDINTQLSIKQGELKYKNEDGKIYKYRK